MRRRDENCGTKKPLIIIEHLEPIVSRWLLLEYMHSYNIAGDRLAITNGGLGGLCRILRDTVLAEKCFEQSVVKLKGILYRDYTHLIVLDPQAEKPLSPQEASKADAVVIGGILGDYPPRGRTRKLLTSRIPQAVARNIGNGQYSIDGAVYVAKSLISGRRLEEIDYIDGLRLNIRGPYGVTVEVLLPYRYPLVNGRPLVHPKLPELLATGLAYEEVRLARVLAEDDNKHDIPYVP